jgi:hypothetical protein
MGGLGLFLFIPFGGSFLMAAQVCDALFVVSRVKKGKLLGHGFTDHGMGEEAWRQ